MQSELVKQKFGNRIRNRACAIVIKNNQVLLIAHDGLREKPLLSPPGGEPNFGESLEQAVVRELLEETHLKGIVQAYLFSHEFIDGPLHAIEHFFLVKAKAGIPKVGVDPEISPNHQIIKSVKFWKYKDFKHNQQLALHHMLKLTDSVSDLLSTTGHYFNGKKTVTKV